MNVQISGNPIRSDLLRRTQSVKSKAYGLIEGKRTILVFGGSQGSKPINMHILENLKSYIETEHVQLLWQTGTTDYKQIINEVGERDNVKILPFLTDMGAAYASADMAICRAGALTIAELAVVGLPSILIPLPHAAEKHQDYNAKLMADAGAALIVNQSELTSGILEKNAFDLLFDEEKLEKMSAAAKELAEEDAALKIINSLFKVLYMAQA